MTKPTPLYLRFWTKVSIKDGCWPWKAGVNQWGYGRIWVRELQSAVAAPRVMWFLRHGEWPKLDVLHSCDNPPCVNPAHLSEGTAQENGLQCVARGRHPHARKTHCRYGHPFDSENTYISRGRRYCRACLKAVYERKQHGRASQNNRSG